MERRHPTVASGHLDVIFFPYRAQIKLHKLPVVTIGVAAVCLLVYLMQSRSEARVEAHAKNVCARLGATSENGVAAAGYRFGDWTISCADMVLHIHAYPDPETHIDWHAGDFAARGDASAGERLRAQYRAFVEHAPVALTAHLWHDRSRFDPVGMITSSFAHASWEHVIFNLIFFFAFAATVELIVGPVLFIGAILALSLGIGVFDHFISRWEGHRGPSLGLSGVVMGMLALFVYFLPRAKIRFFFWFMLSVGAIGIPAWLVALWYVGWDLYYQLVRIGSSTNFVAHLAGAAFGLAIGVTLFRAKRHWAQDLVIEKVDLTQEEGWLTKLNALMVGPAIAGFAFLAAAFLLLVLITFISHFWIQMLLAAPAVAAGIQLYRQRRAERPAWEHYRLGMRALERHEFHEALKHLKPLAQQNDVRALYALAQVYAAGKGTVRDEAQALELYRRAAERGHAPAQHALGAWYADGRAVERNPAKAVEW